MSKSETPISALSSIVTGGSGLPNRYVIHAVEGFGKTSFGAMAPKPIFIEAKGETGLETLIDAGQLPPTPHFPESLTWLSMMSSIDELITQPHDYKTLVLDTINGAERMCHQHVCNVEYKGDWGDTGFMSFNKGYEVSLPTWTALLSKLDEVRSARKMSVVLLCHTKVKPFRNPSGADYDRYTPDMHEKTWGITHKWADNVLFGNYSVTVQDKGREQLDVTKRGKGVGGKQRVMYAIRDAAYDAKNRLGLPEEIDMGNSPHEAWGNFAAELKKAKESGLHA